MSDDMVPPQGAFKKGPWTAEEDAILIEYVMKNGVGDWNAVMRNSGLNRCGKSCRLRWTNQLRPNLKRDAISPEEEAIIVNLHSMLGNKWAQMASQLPGRTDNEIKNFWNTRLKKRQKAGLPIYPIEVTNPEIQNPEESGPSNFVSGSNNFMISLYDIDIFDSSVSMTTHPDQYHNMSNVSDPIQNYTIFNQDFNSSASRAYTFNGQPDAALNNHNASSFVSQNPQFQFASSNFGFDPNPIATNPYSNPGSLHASNIFSGDLYGESYARNTVLGPSQEQLLWDYNLQNPSFIAASSMETTPDWYYDGDGNLPNGRLN